MSHVGSVFASLIDRQMLVLPLTIVQSTGNVFTNCTGTTAGVGGNAFTPSYAYTLDATGGLQTAVQNGAGPQ